MINIAGLDKAAVLAALYNNAKDLDDFHQGGRGDGMTVKWGVSILWGARVIGHPYVDRIGGRRVELDPSTGDEFDEQLYDHYNGEGKAALVIERLRLTGSIDEIIDSAPVEGQRPGAVTDVSTGTVSIKGLDKPSVFAALWNNAQQPPEGFDHLSGATYMSRERAAAKLHTDGSGFVYFDASLLKVSLSDDAFDPQRYDRDNGAGLAARVIAQLRSTGSIDKID